MSLFPMVALEPCRLDVANDLLVRWEHRMGPINRPNNDTQAHQLLHEGEPVGIVTTSWLVREWVGGGLTHLTRENTVELSRLCAARPGLCRVLLRLWREFVFPVLPYAAAISYQDAAQHTGNLYRFDGWKRAALSRAGGTDQRSGRKGRDRWVWVWPPEAADA
jgi:hypothetical protein